MKKRFFTELASYDCASQTVLEGNKNKKTGEKETHNRKKEMVGEEVKRSGVKNESWAALFRWETLLFALVCPWLTAQMPNTRRRIGQVLFCDYVFWALPKECTSTNGTHAIVQCGPLFIERILRHIMHC